MNRRGFLGALAALVGAITAKVKAGPSVPVQLPTEDAVLWGHKKLSGDWLYFTENRIWTSTGYPYDPCSPEDIAARHAEKPINID